MQIKSLNLLELESVGDYFLRCNRALTKVDFPELESIGDYFLCQQSTIQG